MTRLGGRPRALIITPSFFGYERDIAAEFENQGWSVTLTDERPSNSVAMRAVLRVRKGLAKHRIAKYFRSWQSRLDGEEFDFVLTVKAEVVPPWFIEWLKIQNPTAQFVFYAYDALANASNCEAVLHYFDRRLSFDRVDVEARSDLEYLPLFYTEDFVPVGNAEHRPTRHNLTFVGTLHTQRYRFAQRCFSGEPNVFGFFYVPAAWYFAIAKYVTREHRRVPWSDVSFKAMTKLQVAKTFLDSHAVLDMQREGQHGLTMRTFEVLASGAILVTTNAAVKSEPFYDADRVIIVPSDPAEIDPAALRALLADRTRPGSAPDGFGDYSLTSWVKRLAEPVAERHAKQ